MLLRVAAKSYPIYVEREWLLLGLGKLIEKIFYGELKLST